MNAPIPPFRITTTLAPDGKQVRLSLVNVPAGQPVVVSADLDVASLDGVIRALGALRQQIAPTLCGDFDRTDKMEGVDDPTWSHDVDSLAQRSIVSFLHPRFGWQHFVMPKAKAGHLGALLVENSKAVPLTQALKN